MKERPILFSGEMVRAILDGRKTMTRRVVPNGPFIETDGVKGSLSDTIHQCQKISTVSRCPYGKVGDRLWVRETCYIDLLGCANRERLAEEPPEGNIKEFIYYRADGECCEQIPECQCGDVGKPKWRPSTHMPRWASRITLEITNVSVERLNEISEVDAKAEGIRLIEGEPMYADEPIERYSAVAQFKHLWDKINGKKHPWASNPWVWVVEFKKI
jgi:uncharacterized protein YqfB (UPF0267 family)